MFCLRSYDPVTVNRLVCLCIFFSSVQLQTSLLQFYEIKQTTLQVFRFLVLCFVFCDLEMSARLPLRFLVLGVLVYRVFSLIEGFNLALNDCPGSRAAKGSHTRWAYLMRLAKSADNEKYTVCRQGKYTYKYNLWAHTHGWFKSKYRSVCQVKCESYIKIYS